MTPCLALAIALLASTPPTPPLRWGEDGHRMAGRAAAETLPAAIPEFFRSSVDRLAYLNPEPDRWRSRELREMDQAWSYDHYIDIENVPAGALDAPDRWAYLRALSQAGFGRPESDGGFLPFRIIELYQRLVSEWRLWRAATDADTRGWIEQRILDDAGTLGHYVTDASNPHHTTVHYNGWAEGKPNPAGYTTSRDFHARFEGDFVRAHVGYEDVRARLPAETRSVAGASRKAVMDHIMAAHALVDTLYRLEKEVGFDPAGPVRRETRDFAAERLASGAAMLRTLWWSAWLESEAAP